MIDDERKCVFVHVPKCAGNSVVKAFGIDVHNHQCAAYYRRQKRLNLYYRFTFIRNPWDRFLSAYLFLKSGGMNDKDKWASKSLIGGRDFEEFILDTPIKKILGQVHFCRYVYFLNGKMDFIGKLENFDEDFKQLLINIDEYKWSNLGEDEIVVPHLNITADKKHYTEYYNDRTAKAIGKLYEKDIHEFGYEFGK